MSSVDFTWLIGGPQGSGVESGANIFSRVCAEMGYQVFGKREFYSNIRSEETRLNSSHITISYAVFCLKKKKNKHEKKKKNKKLQQITL